MKVEEIIREVFQHFGKDQGVNLFEISRDPSADRYKLVLYHVSGAEYNYSTHFLDSYVLTKAYPNAGSMARLLDDFLITAIEEHLALFKDKKPKDIPLFSEAVVGYRRWKLDDWVLGPTNYGSPWRPGVNKAKCQPDSTRTGMLRSSLWGDERNYHDHPPAKDCHCGLNAFFEAKGSNWDRHGHGAKGYVVGAIVGWGDMQVHPDGFRAEYAQIVALVEQEGIADIAGLYQVPLVKDIEELQIEASKHGSPLPENLRPAEQIDDEYNTYQPVSGTLSNSLRNSYKQALYSGGYSSGGTLPPPTTSNPFSWSNQVPSHTQRTKEMLEAAKKANLISNSGMLKTDKELRLEKARKKHEAQKYLEVKNPKKKPWRTKKW